MGLHKLRVLNLENNQLTSSSLQTAVRTPLKLTALSLAHNKLTNVPMWICEHCGYGIRVRAWCVCLAVVY